MAVIKEMCWLQAADECLMNLSPSSSPLVKPQGTQRDWPTSTNRPGNARGAAVVVGNSLTVGAGGSFSATLFDCVTPLFPSCCMQLHTSCEHGLLGCVCVCTW